MTATTCHWFTRQAEVRSDDGHRYAISRHTLGLAIAALHEGQRLRCKVYSKAPASIARQSPPIAW